MKVVIYAAKTVSTFLAILFFLFLCLAFQKDEGNIIHKRLCEDGISTRFKKISIDEGALMKRADIDLNRSPPRSPSPTEVGKNVEKSYKTRGRKRKEHSNLTAMQKERNRNATMIAMRKYRSKWSDEAHEKAKKDLSPEEYAKYKEKYDNYKRLACQRAQKQYEREKKELNENDPIAIERRQKRLKRYRDYYFNVTKAKAEKQKVKKDTSDNEHQDKSNPASKRALNEDLVDEVLMRKRAFLDLNRSPPESPTQPIADQNSQRTSSSQTRGHKRKHDDDEERKQKEQRRFSSKMSMRKFRSKWTVEGHEKAKKVFLQTNMSSIKKSMTNIEN